ncbi:hypothetical protein B0H12DRAFT_1129251 [Mycena haematopus]|nr:hypothetical protein B0H12DRAFT_1129251 [Mycena haematopus]
MPTSRDITLVFCYPGSENHASKASIVHKTDETFSHLFRHLEASWALFGKKKGSLAFSYNQRWLEDSETPQAAGMRDGDIVNCVEVLRLTIIHPNSSARIFTVDPADVSVTFSTLFDAYATATGMNSAHLRFTIDNDGMQLLADDQIVETLHILGRNSEDFLVTAMPTDFGSSLQENVTDAGKSVVSPPTIPGSLNLEPSRGTTPEAMLQELRFALQIMDAHWLSTLIFSWPMPCPLQNDDEILRNFARYFMAWRDDRTERGRLQTTGKFLAGQVSTILSLEKLYHSWRAESLAAWEARESAQRSSVNALQHVIQANAIRRMLREASIISILGQLIVAWKTHLTDGLALLSSGPGLHSDERILRECRAITAQHQTVEHILEAHKIIPNNLDGDTIVGGASPDFFSLFGSSSQGDLLQKIEQTSTTRRSARLKPTKQQESPVLPAVNDPPLSPRLQKTRTPTILTRPDTFLSGARKTRRETIQHEWNTIAREAGAVGMEFINEIDDEEVPPGVGILFPYVERTYLFDIGIAKSTPLAGCRCHGKKGCNNARRCACQSNLEGPPAYTAKGLFTFNTDSEIIECSNVCECSVDCINRAAQFPRQIPVQIFKTMKRGWGARLPVDIVRGRVVGLYTGLLIRREEADKLSGSRASYCFDLDVNEEPDEDPPENAYSVDAYGCGNWTRFINHSCSPNLQIISVVYDTMPEDNMPYLALVATENIPAFTELTVDYNPAHQTEWQSKTRKAKARSKKNKSKKLTTRCLCGTKQCRGWLPVAA